MATSVEEELQQLVASIAASISAVETRVGAMEAVQAAQAQAHEQAQAAMAAQVEEPAYVPLGLVQHFADSLKEPYLRDAALAILPSDTSVPAQPAG